MPKTTAERSREFRVRERALRHAIAARLLKVEEELKSLRHALRHFQSLLNSSPLGSPLDSLPNPLLNPPPFFGTRSKRAPHTLTEWKPNDKHKKLASEQGKSVTWLDDQADRYRCWLANAKHKHVNFDAGFRNWIKSAAEHTRMQYVNNTEFHAPQYGPPRDPTEIARELGLKP